jgi:hypothetical protein
VASRDDDAAGGESSDAFDSLVNARYYSTGGPTGLEHWFGGVPRRPTAWAGGLRIRDQQGVVLAELRARHTNHLWVGRHRYRQSRGTPSTVTDLDTGRAVAEISGRNFNRRATLQLTVAHGPVVRFPVAGKRKGASLLVATTSDGTSVAYLRWTRPHWWWYRCEIAVPPGSLSRDDLGLVMLIGARAYWWYFKRPGGGG